MISFYHTIKLSNIIFTLLYKQTSYNTGSSSFSYSNYFLIILSMSLKD